MMGVEWIDKQQRAINAELERQGIRRDDIGAIGEIVMQFARGFDWEDASDMMTFQARIELGRYNPDEPL